MSKIRLHGSSSGHTEVAPAAAAGNNTVTLPNSAGTLLLTDGSAASLTQIPAANIVGVATAGFGNGILQVVSTTKTDTFSQALTASTGGMISNDVTGLSVSITPTNASNKILLVLSISCSSSNTNANLAYIYKDGSVLSGAIGDAANDGNGDALQRATFAASVATTATNHTTGQYLDTAGGTSAITYSVRLGSVIDGYDVTVFVNKSGDADEASSNRRHARTISTFTAMEIES